MLRSTSNVSAVTHPSQRGARPCPSSSLPPSPPSPNPSTPCARPARRPSPRSTTSRAASCTPCTRPTGTFVFVEQWADADALKTHSTAPGVTHAVRRDRRAPRRRARHQDADADRGRRPGQGSAAAPEWHTEDSTARSRSSPARPAARAARTRSSWRRKAPTSSPSTSATRSPVGPLPAGHRRGPGRHGQARRGHRCAHRRPRGRRPRPRGAQDRAARGHRRTRRRLDIVIANAGIAPMAGEDAWQDVIDVNLTGVYHTVDVAMRPMIKQGDGGSIVLTSSVAGLVGIGAPIAGSLGYTVAKHGVVGLMRAYANFLAPHSAFGSTRCTRPAVEHADDRQRVHPRVAGRSGPAESGRPGHEQRAAGAGAGARGHRQRGVLPGVRRRRATSPGSRCRSTRGTSTSAKVGPKWRHLWSSPASPRGR